MAATSVSVASTSARSTPWPTASACTCTAAIGATTRDGLALLECRDLSAVHLNAQPPQDAAAVVRAAESKGRHGRTLAAG